MKYSATHKLIQGITIGLLSSMIAILLWQFHILAPWENKTFDWRANYLARPGAATNDICLILLDQDSLDWGNHVQGLGWPWPRQIYPYIINYCKQAGAKSVAFDVLFTEPSQIDVYDDQIFKDAIDDYGRFALGSLSVGQITGSAHKWPENTPVPKFKIQGLKKWLSDSKSNEVVYPRAVMPIPELLHSKAVICNVHQTPDKDAIFRRFQLFAVFDEKQIPSLGLGAFVAANPNLSARIDHGKLFIGNLKVPLDKHGNCILRYRGPRQTYKSYTAKAVVQSAVNIQNGTAPIIKDNHIFKDKYVFFGFSAPSLKDLRPAPTDALFTGVEINATALDNLLSQDFLQAFPIWATLSLTLMLALICGICKSFFTGPLKSTSIILIFIGLPIVLSLMAYQLGYWLPLVVCETALVLTITLTLMANYATEGRQKRFIKNAFGQYLSPHFIDQLIDQPHRLKLGGERKMLSIFFSDIQGFTSFSELLDPEDLIRLLNDYLSAMTDIIQDEGGTIDKYEGDAIIAFWNAPLDIKDHAVRVVRAALACQEKLSQMRPEFRKKVGKDMYMRIGINTGLAAVGNMGSHRRFDYTMMGDAVNLASRLEGVNKQFYTYTMISEATYREIGDTFAVRELGKVSVVGRKEPVVIYEPMRHQDYEEKKNILETFAKGLSFYYQGQFEKAVTLFSEIQSEDPPAVAYIDKCQSLIKNPPQNWQGVWVMSTK